MWVRAQDQFSSLSLYTTRTTPQYQMLVFHPSFYLSYILPRDPPRKAQVQHTSEQNHLLRACQQFHFLTHWHAQGPSTAPQCARWRYRSMPFGTVVLYQWRHSGGLECFQSCLAVRSNTHEFLWSTMQLNFISTGQDSMCCSLSQPENCSIPS